MKRFIRFFFTNAAALSLLLPFFLVSCDLPPPGGVWITAPENGATIAALTGVSGTYKTSTQSGALVEIKFTLMRYADNKFWNGTGWGTSVDLPTTTPSAGQWQVAAGTNLPSGGDLAAGYYLITVRAQFANGPEETGSLFTVGVPAPPVLPALWAWGKNEDSQLGSGTPGNAAAPVPVFMRGGLDGKVIGTVAAGGSHTLAIASGGVVFGWGSDGYGQLGTTAGSPDSSGDFPLAVKVETAGALSGKRITAIAGAATTAWRRVPAARFLRGASTRRARSVTAAPSAWKSTPPCPCL